MKKILLVISAIIVFLLMVGLIGLYWYKASLEPVGSSTVPISIEIEPGGTYTTLTDILYEKKLIKSKLGYRIYLKLNPPKESLKAGTYYFSEDMGVEKIMETLIAGGQSVSPDQIKITFAEGINMRAIATIISQNTNNTVEEVYSLLKDRDYLQSLIDAYWFLDDSILNDEIYYSLEGYLFPNTYYFSSVDVDVKTIFKTLLDEMGKRLEPMRNKIEQSEYSVHEILTLASVIELEVSNTEHRGKVAGVFYNRLRAGMNLGSDPTTYYGSRVELSERDLTKAELDDVNAYNTRVPAMNGKLPVGPICSPSISSIEAAITPTSLNAYYFVADKNGETYFTEKYSDHLAKINELKENGLWYNH